MWRWWWWILLTGCGAQELESRQRSQIEQERPSFASSTPSPTRSSEDAVPISSGVPVVNDPGDLPLCTDAAKAVVFDAVAETFLYCRDGEWLPLGVAGPETRATAPAPRSQVVTVETLEPGDPCVHGGSRFIVGEDTDGDGRLSVAEQANASETTVCGGSQEPEATERARNLYGLFRGSVYKLSLRCAGGTIFASAFRCESAAVCTNAHAVRCPDGSSAERLTLGGVGADSDQINRTFLEIIPDGTTIRTHTRRDLAKIRVTAFPPGALVMPVDEAVRPTTLASVVAMSFPLGFDELYTDLGLVNANAIGTCNHPKYGCPEADFDFSTTNDTDHGSSGGPILDIDTGVVIGVITAGTEGENSNFSWAVGAGALRDIP